MRPEQSPEQWLRRARSNLIRAQQQKPEGVLWEDVCLDAQQAAEKALKALSSHLGIRFRRVHDIAELLTSLESGGVNLPAPVRVAAGLTPYAVETRYPGWYPPVTAEEAREAVQTAEIVVTWVTSLIGPAGEP